MGEDMLFIFVALFGSLIGSFLNVVIVRLPEEGGSIVFPASHCQSCKKPISWYDNIPLLSFIVLRGRCRQCGERISWRYPLVEAAMTFLALALYQHFGFTILYPVYFVFCAALLVVIFIDVQHQIIPDVISLPGIVLGFALSFVNPFVSWQDAGLGILFGGGSLYLVAMGYYLFTKREGMGGGDIKLLAMIGAFLGWQSLPFVVFASSVLGTVVGVWAMVKQGKGGKTVIPYGPFLAIAAMMYLFFRQEIILLFVRLMFHR
ncbi:MAG TPA: prepilin peptidase [Desulfobulbaceae bacterium]|nr:MAG: peptidase A24 [Deltaproteobacteria bacterium RIFOXYD12_FULL_53_23]HCC55303.1 prepilin peptidase [Desulfobulbaceae bacterium]